MNVLLQFKENETLLGFLPVIWDPGLDSLMGSSIWGEEP